MVTKYGFSKKIGTVVYGSDNDEVFLGKDYGHTRNYSEAVAAQIDDEVRSIIEKAYSDCTEILKANADKMHFLAKYLLKFEKIDGEDFEKLMKGELSEDILNTPDETEEKTAFEDEVSEKSEDALPQETVSLAKPEETE